MFHAITKFIQSALEVFRTHGLADAKTPNDAEVTRPAHYETLPNPDAEKGRVWEIGCRDMSGKSWAALTPMLSPEHVAALNTEVKSDLES